MRANLTPGPFSWIVPYLAIIRLRFAVQLQYRAAAFAAGFTNYFFGFIRVMVYMAFYASSTAPQPLTLAQAVTYTWLTQVTFRLMPWVYEVEIINQIRSGAIAYELCRPVNMYFAWYSRLFSQRLVPTLLTGIPVYVLAVVLPGDFALGWPASPAAAAAWLLSLLLAMLLGCALTNMTVITTLWTIAGDGMVRIFPAAIMLLSGTLVPLAYFPDWMQTALRLLPFSGLIDIPANIYMGIIPASQVFIYGLLQLFWITVFILIGLQLFNMAIKKLELQGG
jgi:ABC-2 type transport system permease protein